MASHNSGIDSVSIPVAILVGAIIIGGTILFGANAISKSPALTAPVVQGVQGKPAAPAPARTGNITQVKTAGSPIVGSATAPIVMAYWFDYQCPVCKSFEQNVMTQVKKDYIDTGKIRVVFKDLQFLGEDSFTLGVFARAVWQLAPDKFAAWHSALFQNQGREHSNWATSDTIKSISTPVLGADLTAKAMALAASDKTALRAKIDADKTEGGAFGINATPSYIIGDKVFVGAYPYETVKAAIEAALKK